MNEEMIKRLLGIPGARRAAQGVIIPGPDGGGFHIRNVFLDKEAEGLSGEEAFFIEFCSKKEVSRLRDGLKGADDYLLRLRARAIANSPRAVRVMLARKKKVESVGRPWSLTQYYHARDYHHKSYINCLTSSNAKRVKGIPSGLAYIREANAMCIRSVAGDVVVASESLEQFYYFMSIAFYGAELAIDLVDRADALLIAIRIMNASEALDFDLDPRGVLPPRIQGRLNQLVSRQMQFTFGHEYAHLLCEHLSPAETLPILSSLKEGKDYLSDLRIYNHELEFEADLCALTHVEHNRHAFPAVAQGAFSVLAYLHFLEVVQVKLGLKPLTVSVTHPTAKQRIHRLHSKLGPKSPMNEGGLSRMYEFLHEMERILLARIDGQREDLLTLYGSIYLSSYVTKPKRDRYDY